MKKYLLKPKITDTFSCMFKDKEINIITENKTYKEIKKELETWVYYGRIKEPYKDKYEPEVKKVIEDIIKKYHKDYKDVYDYSIEIERKYGEASEEEEPELEKIALEIQKMKNEIYYDYIIKEFEERVGVKK